MAIPTYRKGAELPDVAVTWTDEQTGIIDFTSGWTFSALIGQEDQPAQFAKSSGFTGSGTAPNLIVAWAPGELDGLAAGTWVCDIEARNTVAGKDRKRKFEFVIEPVVLPV